MFRKSSIIVVGLLLLVALALARSVRADETPTPEPDHMQMEGTPEGDQHEEDTAEADHDHGPRIPANGAAVKIISPKDGALLDRPSVIVRVETTNWPLGEEGHHWHLLVNGKEQGMSQGNAPALQANDLQPGENVIEAVLSNELHQELDATHKISIHYDTADHAAEASNPVNTPSLSSGVVIVLVGIVAVVAAILGIGFALMRKKA